MQKSKPAVVRAWRTSSESGGLRSENLVVVKALFGFLSSAAMVDVRATVATPRTKVIHSPLGMLIGWVITIRVSSIGQWVKWIEF